VFFGFLLAGGTCFEGGEKDMDTRIDLKIDDLRVGLRLDAVVSLSSDNLSRNQVADMIRSGMVRVDGAIKKPGYRLKPGEVIIGKLSEPSLPSVSAEEIPLDIIYEDKHVLVISKPAGMVVHPAPGSWSGTLVNALLAHCPSIEGVGEDVLRPGIVHRLDKDTSGVMVVAKSIGAHGFLKKEFQYRRVEKRYLALVSGEISDSSGLVTLPIGRHPVKRKRMAVNTSNGRVAITLWHKRSQCRGATLVEVELKTGRTHQIRVHFKALGYPLIGDTCYGRRFKKKAEKHMAAVEKGVGRQMLHAWKIGFRHPWSGRRMDFSAPMAGDMKALICEHGMWDSEFSIEK